MLAATRQRQDTQALLRVILAAIDENSTLSSDLKNYFMLVLNEAQEVASQGPTTTRAYQPESFRLALEMQRRKVLHDELSQLRSFDELTPEKARRVLSSMENLSAA